MRVTVEREGKKEVVEVAADFSSVRVRDRSFPVSVAASSPMNVELEIAGERVMVDRWPEHAAQPPGPVDVNGERWSVAVLAGPSTSTVAPAMARPLTLGAPPVVSEPSPASGTAFPILPPMPGRVIEVRVKEGDAVHKGDVLLVLEAMKMRNEISSPVDGVVRGLRVSAGTNARAKEPMLSVVPDPGP